MDELPKADVPLDKAGRPRYGKGSNFVGKPGRSGSNQIGNTNATRHGLTLGKLPQHLQFAELRANAFRRELETAVLDAVGEIRLHHATRIWAAARRFRHIMLRDRHMRQVGEQAPEFLVHAEKSDTAADALVKLVDGLPIDRDARQNIVDSLYRTISVKPVEANVETNGKDEHASDD